MGGGGGGGKMVRKGRGHCIGSGDEGREGKAFAGALR